MALACLPNPASAGAMLSAMNTFDKRAADAEMRRVLNAVGGLISNLGLFELHMFRCISHLQLDPTISECASGYQFDQRVKLTKRLLAARKVSDKLQEEFSAMAAEMKPIMPGHCRSQRGSRSARSADGQVSRGSVQRQSLV